MDKIDVKSNTIDNGVIIDKINEIVDYINEREKRKEKIKKVLVKSFKENNPKKILSSIVD